MKILETIQGASENIVVYQNEAGEKIAVARPKVFTLSQIIEEIQNTEKNSDPKKDGNIKNDVRGEKPGPDKGEGAVSGKTPQNLSIFDSNALKDDKGEITPKRSAKKQGGN